MSMEGFRPDPAFEQQPETGAAIVARLQELEAQAGALEQSLGAARAELERVRRRAREDHDRADKFAIEGMAKALLPFKDSLETALRVDTQDAASLRTGIEMMLRQLQAALEGSGLTEIAPQPGEAYDPQRHRALSEVKDEPVSVAALEQKGYMIGNRLIRPATVRLTE